MKVIILAQGLGSRWKEGIRGECDLPSEYKQLIPLKSGETLLSRTIRQIKENGIEYPVLVAKYPDFEHLVVPINELREPTGSIIHGILSLRHVWMNEKECVFILGDVAFSNIMLSSCVKHKLNGITFYGRKGKNEVTGKEAKEIFALSVCGNMQIRDNFYRQLLMLRDDTSYPKKLKLWDLYNWLDVERAHPIFVTIDLDYTDDIDSPESYQEHFPKLEEAIYKDDDRHKNSSVLLCSEEDRRKVLDNGKNRNP